MESYELRNTPDLLRQDCPMVIVVVLVVIPFVQICNMVGTGSEHTDRGDFLSGRTLSLHVCATLPRRVHHYKLTVDRDFQKKHKNVFPIFIQSFIQSLFPILTNSIPIVTPTIYQSLMEEKSLLSWIDEAKANIKPI
jgi:hypothetical protein